MMLIGQLDRRVRIYSVSTTANGYGELTMSMIVYPERFGPL